FEETKRPKEGLAGQNRGIREFWTRPVAFRERTNPPPAPGVALRSRDDLDLGAEALRRKAAVPSDAERALRAVEGHDPAQELQAILAGPHHPGSQQLRRLLGIGEVHDRLVAVLLELALPERGHDSGRLGLGHPRSETTHAL